MKVLLVLAFAFAQNIVGKISNDDAFYAEWKKRSANGSISRVELEKWAREIWGSRMDLDGGDTLRNSLEMVYQNIARLDSKRLLGIKKVDNSESIRELTRAFLAQQAAYAECPKKQCPDQQRVQIVTYNNMLRHLVSASSNYHYSGYHKQSLSGALDIDAVKREYGKPWLYDVKYSRPQSRGRPQVNLPNDDILVEYNRYFCECFKKNRALPLLIDCVKKELASNTQVNPNLQGCLTFGHPNEQPSVHRVKDCNVGERVVPIMPFGTQYFVGSSCTLDVVRVKGFFRSNVQKASGGSL